MAVFDENWDYHINTLNVSQKLFDKNDFLFLKHIPKLNCFKVENFNWKDNVQNDDIKLKRVIETNKQLREEIETKREELVLQQSQYEKFKQDQKLLSEEIINTHEAFLMAKKYYKKYLKMYYTIESKKDEKQTIYVQFFTETKRETENYSVRLARDTKLKSYELLETKPKLAITEAMKTKLKETDDLPSVLCSIREAFIEKKNGKKK